MTRLPDKTALITGASKGLGYAVAERFAREGCAVAITSRSLPELEAAAERLRAHGTEVIVAAGDIADEADVQRLFERVRQAWGRLDLLVNNAGAFNGGPLTELSVEDWDRVIATNLRGPFLCTREALRMMQPQGVGRIINIGSISAQRVRPGSGPYSTSKHGLWGLTQVTALEGREYGVTCGCIHPGNILVERRHTERQEDQEPMIAPEDIAEVALTMAALPPHCEMLEAVVLPHRQAYVGRG
ncbi:SDR family NAD(P)-dependent oxidoreductase [Lignipirellula cremea]|uniref:Glucose 1-dehydrogenase 2 n=1 Tax=Lignipirellula cremea TaxID=2528010 RepID=A0A518DNG8_9BACT|nr:SDR family oxidoreductase [Lignipirellula cremea]QDU93379.1 Glucose 1-dehydrogenase 2 [Lignipirellula cremea]